MGKATLKIKSFWGHSENAVKTQVWIAVYVLVAIAKNLPFERRIIQPSNSSQDWS